MSIEQYQALQQKAEANIQQPLAKLTAASLVVSSDRVDATTVIETVNSFDATAGWVMYRDQNTALTQLSSERTDFIEGEWFNGTKTVKAKHLGGNEFLLVAMEQAADQDNSQVFKTVQINTRHGIANYDIWYQQFEGRWQALCQQFVGFSKEVK